jgi:DNA-binding GntR family transcriptional regulator
VGQDFRATTAALNNHTRHGAVEGALYCRIVPRKNATNPRAPREQARRASGAGERANKLYDSLRNMIVRGQLAPGSRIVETEVAERFGVSRTPVRAAFQRLEREGYVIASPTHQARMTVAPLTREDVGELLEIVGELEGLAARSAAVLPDPERERLAKDLTTLNADFRRAASARGAQPGKLYELDEKFHRRYVEAGAGSRLRSLHDAVKPQAERYIRMYIALLLDTVATAGTEHDAIVEAIRTGNSGAAQRAVQTNWRHAADRLARAIEVMGEQGNW